MVVFCGSPDFSVPALEILLPTKYRPALVITQPDRPAGRGKAVRPTPVRSFALEHGIPVRVIERFASGGIEAELRSLEPDFLVLVAFGLILPQQVLTIPRRGNLNVHASLLPAYRGASPINQAVVNGDLFTGVTTMEMVAAVDEGPIYLQRMVPIDPMENAGELSERIATWGAELLLETLERIDGEGLQAVPQPGEGISTAPKLLKSNGLIPWARDAVAVHNHIRGMNPWPGSFTYYRGTYLKIHRAEPIDLLSRGGEPGQILTARDDSLLVACGRGTVAIRRLQRKGKRPMDAADFLRGYPIDERGVFGG